MTRSPETPARTRRIEALGYDFSSQPKRRIECCELCGSDVFVFLNRHDRYGYAAPAASCMVCSLTVLNPVMTGEAYGDFYDRYYRPLVSAYHGRLIDAETIQDEQHEYARSLGDLIEADIQRRNIHTMLDIGGSTGVVALDLADRFSLKATVLDPAADELDWAKKFGVDTINGFVEDYEPDGRLFDLIILCQTADHLADITGSLAKIVCLLAPGGLFFVDIVDFRAAYLRNGGASGAIKIDHPYYLTELTVEPLLRNAGFRIVKKSFASDGLHIGYVCEGGKPTSKSLPDPDAVQRYFDELRFIENSRR